MLKNFKILSSFCFIWGCLNPSEANINEKLACGRSSASKYLTLSTPTSSFPNTCTYTIKAKSLYVCQLRVDFDINLIQPTLPTTTNNLLYPQCIDDVLQIGNFRLCGSDTNQHIYIPFNRTAGDRETTITVTTAARNGVVAAPTWNLRVTQLECSLGSPLPTFANDIGSFVHNLLPDALKPRTFFGRKLNLSPRNTFYLDGYRIAPNGCTQYYPDPTGIISSFNYNNGNGVYPGDMRYSICFRRNQNTKSLTLTSQSFELGYEPSITGLPIDSNCYAQVYTAGKSEDFLMIPQATVTSGAPVRGFYFCGTILNTGTVITSIPAPLSLLFNADRLYVPTVPETGFRFNYIVA